MVDAVRGHDVPVTVRRRTGCISLLARFPMKVEGVSDVSRRGHPVTTAFSATSTVKVINIIKVNAKTAFRLIFRDQVHFHT